LVLFALPLPVVGVLGLVFPFFPSLLPAFGLPACIDNPWGNRPTIKKVVSGSELIFLSLSCLGYLRQRSAILSTDAAPSTTKDF